MSDDNDLQEAIKMLQRRCHTAVLCGVLFLVAAVGFAMLFRRTLQAVVAFEFHENVGPYEVYCQSVATLLVMCGHSVCALLSSILGAIFLVHGLHKNPRDEIITRLAQRQISKPHEGETDCGCRGTK